MTSILANLAPTMTFKSWLSNGTPNAFGTVNTYSAGTATPIATWTDVTATTPNGNPTTLNARGEMPMYLLPNIAYKIVEADSFGNSIKTTDNVVNNQLITLYGGVDTGSANAYMVSFTANFSSYIDGIIVYFTPANTNTGPSTVNVNGLGPINILGPNGLSIGAGDIISGYPAGVIYKGGSFYLLSSPPATTGTFTGTFTGFVGSPTTQMYWTRIGNTVTLTGFAFNGVSNATTMTMTGVPASLVPARTTGLWVFAPTDNSVASATPGAIVIGITTGTLFFYKDITLVAGWTASGTKGGGEFTLTYPLT